MTELLQIGGSLGVGAFLGALIFLMYRKDRRDTEKRIHQVHEAHCERMDEIISRDQKSREENTKALTELNTYLKIQNGKSRRR